jgi:arylsulfatase A-like enzyme
LTGELSGPPHEYLFYKQFAWNNFWAVRHGDWKLVGRNENERLLYNISLDPAEKNNVAAQYPEVAEDLRKQWEHWAEGTKETTWSFKE